MTQVGPVPNHLLMFNKLLGISAGEPLLLSAPVRDVSPQAARRCSTLDKRPTHAPPAPTPAAVRAQVQSEQRLAAAETLWRDQHTMGGATRRVISTPGRDSMVAHELVIANEAGGRLVATEEHEHARALDTRGRVGTEVGPPGTKAEFHRSPPQVQDASSPSVAAIASKQVSAGHIPLAQEEAVRGLARRYGANAPRPSQISHLRKGFIQFPATSTMRTEEVSKKASMKRFSEDEADERPGCAKRARVPDPLELSDDDQSSTEDDMDDEDYVPGGAKAPPKPLASRRKATVARARERIQKGVLRGAGRPSSKRTQRPSRSTLQRESSVSDLSDSSQSSRASFEFSDGSSSTSRRSSVSSPLTSISSSQDIKELDDGEAERDSDSG